MAAFAPLLVPRVLLMTCAILVLTAMSYVAALGWCAQAQLTSPEICAPRHAPTHCAAGL